MPDLPGGGWGFMLEAASYEPREDPAWTLAGPAAGRELADYLAGQAASLWQTSRALGLDRWGRSLIPIHPLTAIARRDNVDSVRARPPYSPMGRADPDLPPLTPVGAKSRTRSLFRWVAALPTGIWFYWAFDGHTGRYWGEILARHARGFHQFFRYPKVGWGYVPPRDVLGFSPVERATLRRLAADWWAPRRLALTQRAMFTPIPAAGSLEITAPAGARVLPRALRGPSPFARRGQVRELVTAQQHVETTIGTSMGPGTIGIGFRVAPPRTPVPRRPTFGPSQATPTLLGRAGSGTGGPEDRAMVLDRARAILKKPITPADLASLAGAPDDATVVRVRVAARGQLATYLEGPGWFGATTLRAGEKRPVLEFDSLQVEEAYQGGGLATRIVGRMLEHARRLGVGRVTTEAAAGGPNVGYRVWPRMGFDGVIPEAIREQLPDTLKAARRLLDLMATPEGRAWWDEHGDDVHLEFDLTRGSASWRAWDAYLRTRR